MRTVLAATAIVLAVTPGAAVAGPQVAAPGSVPAGKAAIARVDAGRGVSTCSLTARRGKDRQGPFRLKVKRPVVTAGWQVPSNARGGRWTLAVRCAKTAARLSRAKADTAAITVRTNRSGGVRRLIKGSVRATSLHSGDFLGVSTPKACAAAWNGYASTRDESTYCTGYDAWYAFRRLANPQLKGLGQAADWYRHAQARGLAVGRAPAARAIAWWAADRGTPAHVAFVERVSGTAVTVKEMNRRRWNQVSTRTLRTNAGDAPDGYIAAPAPAPPVAQAPLAPLPVVQTSLVRGPSRTAEIVSAVYPAPGSDTVSYSYLGFGAGNIFRAEAATGLQGRPYPGKWIFSGDVDGDRRADIVSTEAATPGGPAHYAVARSNGNGRFTPVVTDPALPRFPAAAAVLDANADGKADIVTIEDGPAYVVALSNGDGTFTRRASVPAAQYSQRMTAGDFDGDGRTDILVAESDSENRPLYALLRSNGDGTFTRSVTSGASGPQHTNRTAAGDVNGDGKADLVKAVSLDGSAYDYYVAYSNGDGTFATGPRVATGANSQELRTGDVNGDGHVDLVTNERVSTAPEGTYVAALGDGHGKFTRTVLATGVYALRMAVGDIDGR